MDEIRPTEIDGKDAIRVFQWQTFYSLRHPAQEGTLKLGVVVLDLLEKLKSP